MSDHGFPDDHHHFDNAADDAGGEDVGLPEPQDDAWPIPADDGLPDPLQHHDADPGWEDHAHLPPAVEDFATHHDTALPEAEEETVTADDPVEVFPPMLDVGALPEPVDGWPWIDTGSLGLAGSGIVDDALLQRMPAQDPAELAAHNAEDLPPGADPWATLAASEDPATATLAEYYRPGEPDTPR